MIKKFLLTLLLCLTLIGSASAQFTFPVNHFSDTSGDIELLSSIVGLEVDCELDSTIAASTGTAHQWKNVITTPDNGDDQTDCDFYLGTSNDGDGAQPTLTGSGQDQHYSVDGGDYFTSISLSSATTLANAHKTNGTYWFALAYRANSPGVLRPLGSARGVADVGIMAQMEDSSFRRVFQMAEGTLVSTGETAAANDYTSGDDILYIQSVDMTTDTGNNTRVWTVTTTSQAFNRTRIATTASALNNFIIGGADKSGVADAIVPSGSNIYASAHGGQFLTDALASSIAQIWSTRHNISFLGKTP